MEYEKSPYFMDEFPGVSDKKDHFYWTDLLCPWDLKADKKFLYGIPKCFIFRNLIFICNLPRKMSQKEVVHDK